MVDGSDRSSRVAIANPKGGVGKTTVATRLIDALSRSDDVVLAVDLDPQGHLSTALGHAEAYEQSDPPLHRVLLDAVDRHEADSIVRSDDRVDLLPSSIEMIGSDREFAAAHVLSIFHNDAVLISNEKVKQRIADAIEMMADITTPASIGTNPYAYDLLEMVFEYLETDYDIVVIDTPPGNAFLLNNALYSAASVVVPVIPDSQSKRAVERFASELESFTETTDLPVTVIASVINRVRDESAMVAEMRDFLAGEFESAEVIIVPEDESIDTGGRARETGEPDYLDPAVIEAFDRLGERVRKTTVRSPKS